MPNAGYDWSAFGETLNAMSPEQKDLLISTIGNAGAALQAVTPVGQAMVAPGLQNMATKNKMNALLKMLRDYPNSKLTVDGGPSSNSTEGGKTTMQVPTSALTDEAGMSPGEKSGLRAESFSKMSSIGDTFSNFQIGSSDEVGSLVGLTPADVSDMFQIKAAQDELKRRLADISEDQYRSLLMEKAIMDMAGDRKQFTVPGTDIQLSGKEYIDWLRISKDDREGMLGVYDEAVKQAKAAGKKPPGIMEFVNEYQDKDSATRKNYEFAKSEGYRGNFVEYQKDLIKAGVPLSEWAEKETLKHKIDQDAYYGSQKFDEDVLKKLTDPKLGGDPMWSMDMNSDDPKDKTRALKKKWDLIDSELKTGYSRFDGRVEWRPNKKTGRYAWVFVQGNHVEVIRGWDHPLPTGKQ